MLPSLLTQPSFKCGRSYLGSNNYLHEVVVCKFIEISIRQRMNAMQQFAYEF